MSWGTYRFTPLPLAGYDPDSMDLKLIFNPLYCTAVYSDTTVIRALAMDKKFSPIKSYVHTMSRAKATLSLGIRDLVFPFRFKLGHREDNEFIGLSFESGSVWSLVGVALCTLIFTMAIRMGRGAWPKPLPLALVALTGIYGLIAALIADFDQ